MRLEGTEHADLDVYKVWMNDTELEELRRAAANHRDDLIIQLGGYIGLRAFEIPQIKPKHIKRTDGNHFRLRVPEGKDTTGNGGKPRDAYLPASVEADLQRYQNAQDIAPEDPFIPMTERGIRAVINRTADRAAQNTGDEDYRHISSHNLRRRFAQRLLVDKNMNPRVVMAVGGWESFQAIEPYLNAPTQEAVNEEFEKAGLA